MTTPYAALRAALMRDPSRPLVTYVGPEGRTELSVRTLDNNVAKAAGLLRDGLDVQPGDTVVLLLPVHWQAAVWQGASWAVGALASFDPGDVEDAAVALATGDRLAEASGVAEVLRVGRHPFGLPETDPLPPGVLEAATEVRAHSDVFTPYQPPADHDPALACEGSELTAGEVMAAAADLARRVGLAAGGRLLVTADAPQLDLALSLLAVPLSADAAVVISPDAAAAGDERITATLT